MIASNMLCSANCFKMFGAVKRTTMLTQRAIVGAVAVSSIYSGLAAAEADQKVEAISMAALAVAERIDAIDETYTLTQERIASLNPEPKSKVVERVQMRLVVDLRSGCYHYWHNVRGPSTPSEGGKGEYAYDGDTFTSFDEAHWQGTISPVSEPREEIIRKEKVLTSAMLLRPKLGAFGIDDASLVSLLRHCDRRPTSERFGDQDCDVVDVYLDGPEGIRGKAASAWIASKDGILPTRYLEYGRDGNERVDQRIVSTAFFNDGRGGTVALPIRVETMTRVRGDSYRIVIDVSRADTRVNPNLEESAFRVQFPPGSFVRDEGALTTFIVPGERPRRRGGDSGAVSPSSRSTFYLVMAFPGFVVALWALFRARLRRHTDNSRAEP